jgi:hypothetical protein
MKNSNTFFNINLVVVIIYLSSYLMLLKDSGYIIVISLIQFFVGLFQLLPSLLFLLLIKNYNKKFQKGLIIYYVLIFLFVSVEVVLYSLKVDYLYSLFIIPPFLSIYYSNILRFKTKQ